MNIDERFSSIHALIELTVVDITNVQLYQITN